MVLVSSPSLSRPPFLENDCLRSTTVIAFHFVCDPRCKTCGTRLATLGKGFETTSGGKWVRVLFADCSVKMENGRTQRACGLWVVQSATKMVILCFFVTGNLDGCLWEERRRLSVISHQKWEPRNPRVVIGLLRWVRFEC